MSTITDRLAVQMLVVAASVITTAFPAVSSPTRLLFLRSQSTVASLATMAVRPILLQQPSVNAITSEALIGVAMPLYRSLRLNLIPSSSRIAQAPLVMACFPAIPIDVASLMSTSIGSGPMLQFRPREDRAGLQIDDDNAQAMLPPNACVFVAK